MTGFSFENVEGPESGEAGQTISLNIQFDKNIKILDADALMSELVIKINGTDAVSYTHLDVYKRQVLDGNGHTIINPKKNGLTDGTGWMCANYGTVKNLRFRNVSFDLL